MVEYDVHRSKRRCSTTDRLFEPGERYVSVLVEAGDGYARHDYCLEQWKELSLESIGWWYSRVPEKNSKQVYWAPNDVLLAYFEHMLENQPPSTTLFVLGIALVRRKVLKMGPNEIDDDGVNVMVLEVPNSEKMYRVPICEPSPEEISTIQAELSEQLFTDQASDIRESSDTTPELS